MKKTAEELLLQISQMSADFKRAGRVALRCVALRGAVMRRRR